jgi:hypothetical protein
MENRNLSVETENVRKDIRMRAETDSMMSSAWILIYILPIIAAIVWVAAFTVTMISTISTISTWSTVPPSDQSVIAASSSFFAFIVLLYGVMIVSFVVNIVFIYRLAKRRNTHFKRQIFLFEDIVAAVKAIATRKGVGVEVGLASCERTVREAKMEETEKNAVLWAILSVFLGIASLYVWYFLMKDFYKHERREDGFWEDMSKTLDKSGVKFSVPRRTEIMPERSFVLYFILSLVTLGLFGVYWVYMLLQDPNRHFRYHTQIEDQLLTTLEAVPT